MSRPTAELVKRVLVDCLDLSIAPAEIAQDDALYAPHIRLDSLGFHRVIATLEAELGRRFDEDALAGTLFETVGDLIAFAERSGRPAP